MKLFYFVFILSFTSVFAQKPNRTVINPSNDQNNSSGFEQNTNASIDSIPTIDLFHKFSIERDSTQIDTSLTIQKEYLHNYQQKDLLGKVLFANEGQYYNELFFNSTDLDANPDFGFNGKQQNYYRLDDVFYYSVATPFSEIQYRSVMEQGQILNTTFSINTSENLNFSLGYRGLRSLGKYFNQLASNGNFWFSTHFSSKNKRYKLMAHYTGQDLLNQENGGIVNTAAFESGDAAFSDRTRFDVYLTNASSFFKGHRAFLNHSFKLNQKNTNTDLALYHIFKHEYKFFEFNQNTMATTIGNVQFNRFGTSFVDANLRDQARFNNFQNQVGVRWADKKLGDFSVFIENNQFNYFFNKVLFLNGQIIPNSLSEDINSIGGNYQFAFGKFNLSSSLSKSISSQDIFDFNGSLDFKIDSLQYVRARIQSKRKLVDFQKRLFQSDYEGYNWFANFKNEKYNTLVLETKNRWFNGAIQLNNINDFTYFSNDAEAVEDTQLQQIIVSPKQYNKSISHLLIQANKEFFINKFGFDNSIIYQEVAQDDAILNVPKLIFRQSSYYSNHFFKKALYLQTGFTLNYFSSYYANDFNPIIGDFFVQNTMKVGDFPVLDVFLNAKIQTFRVFIKYEHINSLFTNSFYYAAPNQPFRDGMLRFGLTWDFFQ